MPAELSWTSIETWTLILGALGIGMSLGIWVHSTWSKRKDRRADALQKVREKVMTNAERFRNTRIFGGASGNPFEMNKDRVEEATGYYLEVSSAYKAHKYLFKKVDQSKIDAALKEIERDGFPVSISMSYVGREETDRAITLIQETLQRY